MTEATATQQDWGRNLHREFRPFRICEKPIVEQNAYVLKLTLEDGELDIPMMGEQPRYSVAIEDSISRTIQGIEFMMPVDRSKLSEDSGIGSDEIEIALLLKDFKTRNVLTISRWPLPIAPKRFEIPKERLDEISLVDDFEISIVVYLKHKRASEVGIASTKGSTLARCDLTISVESEIGPDFQVSTITPDELEKLGFGRDALFVVEWMEEDDFSRPAKDVFGVRINEIAAQKLMQVQGTNTFGSAFYRQMMSDILFQTAQKIFVRGIDPNWPENSVGKTLLRFVEKATGVVPEKIEHCSKNEIEKLQALLQSALNLATTVQNANLTGRN